MGGKFGVGSVVGLVGLTGLVVHAGAKVAARRIKENPDPYPIEVLTREPVGEEVFVPREDGTRIRAVVGGAGPTVVLSHGYGLSLREWNVVWGLFLGAGYRAIAFDHRGHGRSTVGSEGLGSRQMADDYRAVLEHFDVRDAVLVGHSTGGFLSVVFMLNHPEEASRRLRGAVLFAATASNVLEGAPQNRLQVPLIRAGVIQRIARTETYGMLWGAAIHGENPSPASVRAFCRLFSERSHGDLLPILDALAREDYYGRLGEIRTPCVVICGEGDGTTSPWHSVEMGRRIRDARNVWVERKGHLLNWEAPESLVNAIRPF